MQAGAPAAVVASSGCSIGEGVLDAVSIFFSLPLPLPLFVSLLLAFGFTLFLCTLLPPRLRMPARLGRPCSATGAAVLERVRRSAGLGSSSSSASASSSSAASSSVSSSSLCGFLATRTGSDGAPTWYGRRSRCSSTAILELSFWRTSDISPARTICTDDDLALQVCTHDE